MKECDFCYETHNYSCSGGVRWRKEIKTVRIIGEFGPQENNMCRDCMNMSIMARAEGED